MQRRLGWVLGAGFAVACGSGNTDDGTSDAIVDASATAADGPSQAAPPLLARAGVAGVVAAAPVTLPDGSDAIFERVDLGEIFGCGVVPGPSAQVACWGSNLAGQVTTVATVDGDEVQPVTVVPGLLFDGERVVDLQVRRLHACVIVEPATGPAEIRCWGGKGGNVLRNTPEDPDAGDTFLGGISGAAVAVTRFDDEGGAPVAVALGNEHTCALRSGGAIECWGSDLFGQLGGPGFEAARRTPLTVPVEIIAPQAIAAGGSHTFALDGDGQIWSWGNPASPALGRPVGIDGGEVPVVLDVPHHADRFAAAGTSGGALAEGALWCWGDNSAGLLPGHPTADGRTPTLIADLATAPASRAAVGARFACATDGDRVVCWGQNSFGSACPSATNEIVESCQIVFDEP